MPCVQEPSKQVDVALQILDAVTPRLNVGNELEPNVVRETTQTDHINKRLLTTFLERLNVVADLPTTNNLEEDDDNSQEFED
ncbi:hypothetical protein DOY81_002713 [Sarcophaga bullata]|nr:hypothetical protein DOY81_002713 [Sarcophaga bullata]